MINDHFSNDSYQQESHFRGETANEKKSLKKLKLGSPFILKQTKLSRAPL